MTPFEIKQVNNRSNKSLFTFSSISHENLFYFMFEVHGSKNIQDEEISRLRRELEEITREEVRLKQEEVEVLRRKVDEKKKLVANLKGTCICNISLTLSDLRKVAMPFIVLEKNK